MFSRLFAVLAIACACSSGTAATLFAVQGRVEVERGGVLRLPAVKGVTLKQGDVVRTFDNGEVVIVFDDGSVASVRNNSELKLDAYRLKGKDEERSKVINLAVLERIAAQFSDDVWICAPHDEQKFAPGGLRCPHWLQKTYAMGGVSRRSVPGIRRRRARHRRDGRATG